MKPILVHVHVFYPSVWPELKVCLRNMEPHPMELYVTFVERHEDIEAEIAEEFPEAHVLMVENRGYDVAPFMQVLQGVNLNDYSYVVKLHTKRDGDFRNFRGMQGNEWRRYLLAFCSSPERFRSYLDVFEANPRIGMQADYHVLVERDVYDIACRRLTEKWLEEHGLPRIRFSYVGGAMFIVRAQLLIPLQGYGISLADFPEWNGHEPQLAHVVERLFGYVITAQGYQLEDGTAPGLSVRYQRKLRILRVLRSIGRFFFQSKRTTSGRRIVKFLKIPVYRSRA